MFIVFPAVLFVKSYTLDSGFGNPFLKLQGLHGKKRLMGAMLAALPTVTVALCDDGAPMVPGDMGLFSG